MPPAPDNIQFTGKPVDVSPDAATINTGGSKQFDLASAVSGRIYISYDKALSTDAPDGANPTDKDYRTRFDKVELTYDGKNGKANLTAVDFSRYR